MNLLIHHPMMILGSDNSIFHAQPMRALMSLQDGELKVLYKKGE